MEYEPRNEVIIGDIRPTGATFNKLVIRWFLAIIVCTGATGVFAWRGVRRGLQAPIDIGICYLSTLAWWNGQNPYDAATLQDLAARSGSQLLKESASWMPALYPPPSYVVLSPLVQFGWPAAVWVLLALTTLALIAAGASLSGLHTKRTPAAVLYVVAAVLVFNPVVSGISVVTFSVITCALIIASMCDVAASRRIRPGILLGIGVCLKPQIGIFFLPVLLIRNGKRRLGIALAVIGLIGLAGVIRLAAVPQWVDSMTVMMAESAAGSAPNSPLRLNPYSHMLLNLDVFLLLFTDSRMLATAGAFLAAGCLAVPLWRYRRVWTSEDRTGAAAFAPALQVLAAVTLLPVYHRQYDASILLFAIPATVLMWRLGARKLAVANTALLLAAGLPLVAYLSILRPEWKTLEAPVYGAILMHSQPLMVAGFAITAGFFLRFLAIRKKSEPMVQAG